MGPVPAQRMTGLQCHLRSPQVCHGRHVPGSCAVPPEPGFTADGENPGMTAPCPACGPDFVRWLQADPARETAWLALPRRWVDAGQVLQSVGQRLRSVWFVEQGLLRSHFLNTDGLERNCAFHAEWAWAGMPPPRGAPAVAAFAIDALERSLVVELSHASLAAWLQHRPELQATLTETLLASLMAASRRESGLLMDSARTALPAVPAREPRRGRARDTPPCGQLPGNHACCAVENPAPHQGPPGGAGLAGRGMTTPASDRGLARARADRQPAACAGSASPADASQAPCWCGARPTAPTPRWPGPSGS